MYKKNSTSGNQHKLFKFCIQISEKIYFNLYKISYTIEYYSGHPAYRHQAYQNGFKGYINNTVFQYYKL